MTQPHPQVTALGTSAILLKKMGPAADRLNTDGAPSSCDQQQLGRYRRHHPINILCQATQGGRQEGASSNSERRVFLELAKFILGDKITRKNGFIFHLSRPGADHHARWMSKAICVLKMVLLQHQLPDLHWQPKKKIEKMALFVVFVYLRPWFTASGLSSAAQNDLLFCKSLAKYKKINNGVSSKTLAVLNRYTWYLTEDLISLSLFNEDLSLETRTLLAAQIHQKSSPADIDIRKPTLPAVTIKSELLDFVGPRSNAAV